ncbi:PREDICTED: cilia- and flagella-associated protein 53-like [Gekko japonicus]|uniref:Cilia- and flagella-associated protein 53 n=1 Tax=Gekko japonicus TaxID=146911 RepID=A0ABM1K1W7_GEKJA|nr:PREDICTED: cilia- and flagella-associated protein 53-like [Gekko japonicus]
MRRRTCPRALERAWELRGTLDRNTLPACWRHPAAPPPTLPGYHGDGQRVPEEAEAAELQGGGRAKMLSEGNHRLRREVKGPKPYSIAISAKPPQANPPGPGREIRIWRAQDKQRLEASKYAKAHLLGLQINERDELNERKRLHRLVQKKVNAEMHGFLAETEERRERLRDLLEVEEKGYIAEMESLEETTEDRKRKMLEKAKSLRENREEERRKIVAEKRDQQFRADCEELRTQWSKKHLLEVCEDRLAQLALQEELKKQREQEEATYLALWEEDRLAKEQRAAKEEQNRQARNSEMVNMLNTQRAVAEAQRQEERRLKEEEAKYMEEERQLFKLEDERAEIERRRKLRECGEMLLASAREKMKRLGQARQEELALDMKVLDHILQQAQEDTEEQKRRKKELLKEQQMYRAYLAEQLEEEKRLEREMDKLREEEMARMWAKRAEREKRGKEARERLLKEVLDTRQLQLQEKLQRNAQEQEDLLTDKALLNAAMQEYNRLEADKYARRLRQAKEYQEDLQGQIEHVKKARDFEKEEERREYESALEAERLLQAKIADVLSRPYMKLINLHPLRRQLASSPPSVH